MKYCPICNARYDEEIIKFCTIDGTPLIEEEQPNFTTLPSEGADLADDDFGQETVIRRKVPITADSPMPSREQSERIIIPTAEPGESPVRPRVNQAYYPPPPPNTGKTIVLTILGTVAVLGMGALLFWFLQREPVANVNINTNPNLNQNVNLNTNLGFDSNFNFNTNANFNSNFNLNTNFNTNLNTNTQRPTPTPRPSPTPTQTPAASPTPATSPSPRPTANRPSNTANATPVGTPRTGPRPPTPGNRPPGNVN